MIAKYPAPSRDITHDTQRNPGFNGVFKVRRKLFKRRAYRSTPIRKAKLFLRPLGSMHPHEFYILMKKLTDCQRFILLWLLAADEKYHGHLEIGFTSLGQYAAEFLPDRNRKTYNEDLRAWTPFSEKSVQRAIAKLSAMNLIAYENRPMRDSKHQVNLYAVASCFSLPEIRKAIRMYVYELKKAALVSFSFFKSQYLALTKLPFDVYKDVLLQGLYVYRSITLLNIREILNTILGSEQEKASAQQREFNERPSLNQDLTDKCSGFVNELGIEEELALSNRLKQVTQRYKLGDSGSSFVPEEKKKLREKEKPELEVKEDDKVRMVKRFIESCLASGRSHDSIQELLVKMGYSS